jgi:hypothetical protein
MYGIFKTGWLAAIFFPGSGVGQSVKYPPFFPDGKYKISLLVVRQSLGAWIFVVNNANFVIEVQ